jgi:hypothetical protein
MFRAGLLAALVLALSIAPLAHAGAQTYRIKQGVSHGYQNMRSGPGQSHGIVAQIPAGTGGIAAAGGCQDPDDGKSRYVWCKYSWQGLTGWMSSNGLEQVAGGDSDSTSAGSDGTDGPTQDEVDAAAGGKKKQIKCICGPWFYKICLDPNMGEDGPFPIRDGIQFRGPMGFASAQRGGEGQICYIPAP